MIYMREIYKNYATDCKQKITSWFGNQNVKLKPNLFCRPILGYQRGSGLPLETLFFLSLGSLGIPDKLGEILWCTRSNHEACFPKISASLKSCGARGVTTRHAFPYSYTQRLCTWLPVPDGRLCCRQHCMCNGLGLPLRHPEC